MRAVIKKCRNGNVYYYYESGKIKKITKTGRVVWYSKAIYFKHPKSLN